LTTKEISNLVTAAILNGGRVVGHNIERGPPQLNLLSFGSEEKI
jgi:hypothetical protein